MEVRARSVKCVLSSHLRVDSEDWSQVGRGFVSTSLSAEPSQQPNASSFPEVSFHPECAECGMEAGRVP